MKKLRVHLAQLLHRIDTWASWGECPFCGRHHDPVEHYPLP